ncbi:MULTISPECIES: hypothetical protein [Agrobacterium]|uniref:Uncharacterized protein n=1 Tax=Agrobacterium tumefaciens TaxID=358 RepID=A0A546XMJ9_AGRTU|nr:MULTISPECIES: hypothetical protein [Agrobacterium]MBO0128829.1 hypothetical protein [Agrobacterium sp. OT33]NSX92059.1 hypothetical protein [Agrobacterium tumefaciens]NTE57947.1 hypothetical protein [Agrobacterium tumefaciens]NTE58018.1 hypothetical protein [Agrobacterium tumefaciens]NTE74750.1 hypothetical protein [Agrobacterium tumefaciens]
MSAVAAAGGEALLGRAAAGVATRLGARAALGFLGPVGAAIGLAMLAYEGYELYKMYNESHSEPADGEAGGCTGNCGSAKAEEQKKRQEELEDEAGVSQQTKGKTKHGEKDGGMAEAERDFDSLKPDNEKGIETQYGPGRTGELQDGSKVTVRPGSSDGRPTLQIRRPNGRQTEIRYNDGPGV